MEVDYEYLCSQNFVILTFLFDTYLMHNFVHDFSLRQCQMRMAEEVNQNNVSFQQL